MIPNAKGETITPKKTFEDDEPRIIHIDVMYLSKMPDEDFAPLHVRRHRSGYALGLDAHFRG